MQVRRPLTFSQNTEKLMMSSDPTWRKTDRQEPRDIREDKVWVCTDKAYSTQSRYAGLCQL
ncbi:MAG: hypothetical protein TR69_WS6001000938 [candidate division WS6 bacterium OLB20]|uniref:Uncharacterized protein n=1 Tax=candidate division WS6 bacterium OLB20 TaxID=1617426 RepID=A0A136LZ41_9BACT|nr:MAG: hypothetical protein TR69_WS6001000938 [candidate division WS6 bacterium OLB20]